MATEAQKDKCCCGCENRTVAYFVGWFEIIVDPIMIFIYLASSGWSFKTYSIFGNGFNGFLLGAVLYLVIRIIVCILLIIGLQKQKLWMIKTFVITSALQNVVMFVAIIVWQGLPGKLIQLPIPVLWCYLTWCIHLHYTELEQDQNTDKREDASDPPSAQTQETIHI